MKKVLLIQKSVLLSRILNLIGEDGANHQALLRRLIPANYGLLKFLRLLLNRLVMMEKLKILIEQNEL